ncbi:amino acid adenylation domain-containing protein [Streptococcus pyogenes]
MNINKLYKMTGLQEGMAYHSMYNDKSEYTSQLVFEMPLSIDLDLFNSSWRYLIQEFDILRTKFLFGKSDENYQVVVDKIDFNVQYIEYMDKLEFEKFCKKEREKGFSLEELPLMRVLIMKGNENYKVIWTHHHILLDGWSVGILLVRLNEIYRDLLEDKYFFNYDKNLQVDNYIEYLNNNFDKNHKQYWEKYLENLDSLSFIGKKESFSDLKICEYKETLDKKICEEIEKLSRDNKVTVASFLQMVWIYTLSRYTGNDEVVSGIINSGRDIELKNIENIPGLLINTLPCRFKLENDKTFIDNMKRLHEQEIKSKKHGLLPLSKILKTTKENSLNIFDTLFVYENYPFDDSKFSDLKISNIKGFEKTNYPFVFSSGKNSENNLILKIAYDSNQFNKRYISDCLSFMKDLICKILLSKDNSKIDDICVGLERYFSVAIGNKIHYPKNMRLDKYFDYIESVHREESAIYYDNCKYSYRELKKAYLDLAKSLLRLGIIDGERVGIIADRSFENIVIMLALSKIGATYVPIDLNYPDKRINFIIDDANINKIITYKKLENINEMQINCDFLEYNKIINNENNIDVSFIEPKNNISHIIYTSGTTGNPKGVCVTHENVLNLCVYNDFIKIDSKDVFAHAASISFDAATFEIWTPLLNGCKLAIIKGNPTDINEWSKLILKYGINIAWLTSGLFNLFVDLNPDIFKDFKYIISGGEKLSPKHVILALNRLNNVQIINGYGPTETTTFATSYNINDVFDDDIPIGKPQSNTELFVLGENKKLLPVDTEGELYIGGSGVTEGYLNNKLLTNEKYITFKFEGNTKRLYKTGDIVKLNSSNILEFIGRKDNQVKVRGFRIELDEIENLTKTSKGINDAICLLNDKRDIVLYYTGSVDEKRIKELLCRELPKFMVPKYINKIKNMPLTINGKIDKIKLKSMNNLSSKESKFSKDEYEEILLNIWRDLLGQNNINSDDNFFEVGGDSLLAVRLINKINNVFSKSLKITDLYENPSILELKSILKKQYINNDLEEYKIIHGAKLEEYPLTFEQEQLWFLSDLGSNNSNYNTIILKKINRDIDINKFKESYYKIINRHDIFKTNFFNINGIPKQVVNKEYKESLEIIDIECKVNKKDCIKELIKRNYSYKFDLEKDSLIMSYLIKYNTGEYYFFAVQHHIISDAISNQILLREILDVYDDKNLEKIDISYKDYAVWERKFVKTSKYTNELNFWKKELSGELSELKLPFDFYDNKVINDKPLSIKISKEIKENIDEFCKKEGITFFIFMLTAYTSFLYRYTDAEDIIVGTPFTKRDTDILNNIIGYFVNTLPVRTKIETSDTFKDLVSKIRYKILEILNNKDVPFEKIVNEISSSRDLQIPNIFQTVLVCQENNYEGEESEFIESIETSEDEKFNLTLIVEKSFSEIDIKFKYNSKLYSRKMIEDISKKFYMWIEGLLLYPKERLINISILNDDEINKQLYLWNKTGVSYSEKTFLDEFNKVCKKFPDKISINDKSGKISYSELDIETNYIAHKISKMCNRKELFAVITDKGIDYIKIILGILKSGSSFLPIDSNIPEERIKYILNDAGINTVFVNDNVNFEFDNIKSICITDLMYLNEEHYDKKWKNSIKVMEDDIAYVIYTSGSTGNPKGVLIRHKGILNLCKFLQNERSMNLSDDSKCLQLASISFDASIWEIFPALASGSEIFIYSGVDYSETLIDYIKNNKISHATFTPSLYSVIDFSKVNSLKYVTTAGSQYVENKTINNNVSIINAYGPTEGTVCASFYKIKDKNIKNIPIGKPINNTRLYVLGSKQQLLPIGMPGELYIGGNGVAVGYINNSLLSSEKFVQNPFRDEKDILYRTGDIVNFLEDGNIVFKGRKDNQVKIRGFRIELDEINVNVLKINGVYDAFTFVNGNVNKYIVLFYIGELDETDLNNKLKNILPDYMLPSKIFKIDKFPLTNNGKVDVKKLVDIEQNKAIVKDDSRGAKDTILLNIWRELLNSPNLGIDDNFFESGGDSILSIQVVSKARIQGLYFKTKDIFINQTIRELSDHAILDMNIIEDSCIQDGNCELTPIQQWFFEKNFKDYNYWNQSVKLIFDKNINIEKLKNIFETIYSNHDILRANFKKENNKWVQYINKTIDLKNLIKIIDNTDSNANEVNQGNYHKCISIDENLLSQIIIKKGKDNIELTWIIHHLIIDNVSWKILLEDLERLYYEKDNEINSNLKTTTYNKWAKSISNYQNIMDDNIRSYWEKIIDEGIQAEFVSNKNNNLFFKEIKIPKGKILDLAKKYNSSIEEIIILALVLTFKKSFNYKDLWINMEGHGRHEINEKIDLSRTVGWFTCIYPIKFDILSKIEDNLKEIKSKLRNVPNKGFDSQFIENSKLLTNKIPLLFNFLGNIDKSEKNSLFDISEPDFDDINKVNRGKLPITQITSYILNDYLYIDIDSIDNYIRDEFCLNMENIFTSNLLETLNIDNIVTNSDFKYTNISENIISELSSLNYKEVFDVTGLQEGLLLRPKQTDYLSQWACIFNGDLDIDNFTKSWEIIVNENDILKSYYRRLSDGNIRGFISAQYNQIKLEYIDWSKENHEIRNEKLNYFMKDISNSVIDIEKAPLMRFYLIQLEHGKFIFVWQFHHVLLDGWSVGLVVDKVMKLYDLILQGNQYKLDDIKFDSFLDSIELLKLKNKKESIEFWREYLSDFYSTSLIPTVNSTETNIKNIFIKIDMDKSKQVYSYCRQNHITVSSFLQLVVALLVREYTGLNDILFGMTVSLRDEMMLNTIGLLINTIPARFNFKISKNYKEMLEKIMKIQGEIQSNSHISLSDIIKGSELNKKRPLFNLLYVHENYPVKELDYSLNIEKVFGEEKTNYPLVISTSAGEKIEFKIAFDEYKVNENIFENLESIINNNIYKILNNSDVEYENLKIGIKKEKNKLLNGYENANFKENNGSVREGTFEIIKNIWKSILGDNANYNDDFFEQGGDSLSLARLLYRVKNETNIDISIDDFFEFPKFDIFLGKKSSNIVNVDRQSYQKKKGSAKYFKKSKNILLTGVTGFLGSHLLEELLIRGYNVHTIIRAKNKEEAYKRLNNVISKYHIDCNEFSENIYVYNGDISKEKFGLKEDEYNFLSNSISKIFNSAANVNFMSSFDDASSTNVDGVKNIIEFSENIYLKEIHQISTISVLSSSDNIIINENTPLAEYKKMSISYDKTKWLAEKILFDVSKYREGIHIYRLGRLTGSSKTGIMPENDLLSILIKTIISTKEYPSIFSGEIEANPVDITSSMIVTLSENSKNIVYHLLNDNSIKIKHILDAIKEDNSNLNEVTYDEWLENLFKLERCPLKPLLPLFSNGTIGKSDIKISNELTKKELGKMEFKKINYNLVNLYILNLSNMLKMEE